MSIHLCVDPGAPGVPDLVIGSIFELRAEIFPDLRVRPYITPPVITVESGGERARPTVTKPTKTYGIYHWDTFDGSTFLLGEVDTLDEAEKFVVDRYGGRLRSDGADRVDIVKFPSEEVPGRLMETGMDYGGDCDS